MNTPGALFNMAGGVVWSEPELPLDAPPRRLVVLVPCSDRKLDLDPADRPVKVPAGELYTGTHHRYCRKHAARLGADVVIASALHGLIALDEPVATYNVTIYETEVAGLRQLTTRTRHQAARLGLLDPDTVVVSFLPKPYAAAVAAAGVPFRDLLAGSAGIGEQRGRIKTVTVEALA